MAEARFALLFVLALGCSPGIGDECTSSADCTTGGPNWLCDITQPGGYCTVFNCEPDTCPEDSKCVLFSSDRSTVPGCEDVTGTSPYQRSFCMATCEGEGDCRGGYSCLDVGAADNPWGAVVLDGGSRRVCIVPQSGAPIPDDRSGEVCTGTDQEPEPPPSGGEGGAPMSGGAGGEGGAPMSGGAGGEGGAPMSGGASGEGGAPMSSSSAGAGGS